MIPNYMIQHQCYCCACTLGCWLSWL